MACGNRGKDLLCWTKSRTGSPHLKQLCVTCLCHFGCGRKIRRTPSHFRLRAARYFLIFTGFKGFKLFAAVPTSASCHLWKGISVVPANLAQYQIMGATQGTFDRSLGDHSRLAGCVLCATFSLGRRRTSGGRERPYFGTGRIVGATCILRSINFSPRGGL